MRETKQTLPARRVRTTPSTKDLRNYKYTTYLKFGVGNGVSACGDRCRSINQLRFGENLNGDTLMMEDVIRIYTL